MRNRGAVAALVVLAALATCGPQPAAAALLRRGVIELTPSLGFSHDRFSSGTLGESTFTLLAANGLLGYCLSPRMELIGGLLVRHQAFSQAGVGSVSSTALGLTGGMQYNFESGGRLIPFARSALGVVLNGGDVPGLEPTYIAPSLLAGLRMRVGSSASINYALGYQHQVNARGSRDFSADTYTFEIGVSLFPGAMP